MIDQKQDDQIIQTLSLAKKQGYLTHSQINDAGSTDHFDAIISMLEMMNIMVFALPPSNDELAMLNEEEKVPDVDEAAMIFRF